jgi:predicted unusual protein kinase regulating ubiquinone biosynthesis (AarF/ABC1/UbiB family)
MPAGVARRVVATDLAAAYGPGWQERLVAIDELPAAAASSGQVHRGRWMDDSGQIVDVAVKVQYRAWTRHCAQIFARGACWRE